MKNIYTLLYEIIYPTYIGLWTLFFYWRWMIEWDMYFLFYCMVLKRRKHIVQKQLVDLSKTAETSIKEALLEDIVRIDQELGELELNKEKTFYQYLIPLQNRFSIITNMEES